MAESPPSGPNCSSKGERELEALLLVLLLGEREYGGGVISLADSLRLRSWGVAWDGSFRGVDLAYVNQLKSK